MTIKKFRYALQDGVPVVEITECNEDGKVFAVSNRLSEGPVFSKPTEKFVGVDILGNDQYETVDFGGELISGSLDPYEAELLEGVTLIRSEKDFETAVREYELKAIEPSKEDD